MNKQARSSIRLSQCLLTFLLMLALTGCAPILPGGTPQPTASSTPPTSEANALAGSSWQLTNIDEGGNNTSIVSGSSVTLEFSNDGQATGNAGCNSYGGSYSVDNGAISFGEMVSTKMACTDSDLMTQEQQVLQALSSTDRFEVRGDQLTLWYDNDNSQLIFTAATATTPEPTSVQPTETIAASPTSLPTVAQEPTIATGDFPPNDAKRINFAPGATNVEIDGSIAERGVVSYVLQAQQGQTMSVEITSRNGDVLLSVVGADGTPYKRYQNGPPSWSGSLPATQDYYLEAVSVGTATDYTLLVSITPLENGSTGDFPPSDAMRINFAPGTTSARLHSSITDRGRDYYVLSAEAGQEMSVEITSPNQDVLLSVVGADGTPYKRYQNGPPSWSSTLPITQDYYIEAVSVGPATDYTLNVSISALDGGSTNDFPPSDAKRINFAPGTTSAQINGSVSEQGRNDYVLSAQAGQEMSVEISSPNNDVLLSVVGADGTPYKRYQNGPPSWSSTLPATQDYYIEAVSIGSATDYTLNVSISALAGNRVEAERIEFAPGATSAQRGGLLPSGPGTLKYVLAANANQTMTVDATSDGTPLSMTIEDPTGYRRIPEMREVVGGYAIGAQLTLPATGDYVVTLQKADHTPSTNYSVTFTIQ